MIDEIARYGLEKARDEFGDGPLLFSGRSLNAVCQVVKFLDHAQRGAAVRAFPVIYEGVRFCVTKWSFSREPTVGVPVSLLLSGFRPSSPSPQAKEHMVKALRVSGFSEQMAEVIARLPRDSEFSATTAGDKETLTLRRPAIRRKLGLLLADLGLASCRWFTQRYARDLVDASFRVPGEPTPEDTSSEASVVFSGHSNGSGH